jgi:hypothetical protein
MTGGEVAYSPEQKKELRGTEKREERRPRKGNNRIRPLEPFGRPNFLLPSFLNCGPISKECPAVLNP